MYKYEIYVWKIQTNFFPVLDILQLRSLEHRVHIFYSDEINFFVWSSEREKYIIIIHVSYLNAIN